MNTEWVWLSNISHWITYKKKQSFWSNSHVCFAFICSIWKDLTILLQFFLVKPEKYSRFAACAPRCLFPKFSEEQAFHLNQGLYQIGHYMISYAKFLSPVYRLSKKIYPLIGNFGVSNIVWKVVYNLKCYGLPLNENWLHGIFLKISVKGICKGKQICLWIGQTKHSNPRCCLEH